MNTDLKNSIEKIIANQHADEGELLYQLKQLLQQTELRNAEKHHSRSLSALVSENIKQMRGNKREGDAVKSGFTEFDNLFGGFSPGELVVIGARPSMGKTQLLVNLALNISASAPVLYFTFDLSEFLLTNRFISAISGIAVGRVLNGKFNDEEHEKLASLESRLAEHQIFVNDSCNDSASALRAHCQRLIEEHGVKVILVDYLQMMGSSKYRNNREFEIGLICRELKNIARDFNVCVIATSQLSRAVELRGGAKYPQLSDLRESGSIEQDADKVIFIYRPEYYGISCDEAGNDTAGLMELVLAKNRNGALGTVKLQRNENFTAFYDFDPSRLDFNFSQSRLDELNADNPLF